MTKTSKKPPRRITRPIPISMKVDEKFDFALEFAAKRAGKTKTQMIEESVLAAVKDTGWEAFWHPSKGVRELMWLRFGPRSGSDDLLWDFISEHESIFFKDLAPRVPVIDVLWSDINMYMDVWNKTKGTPDRERAAKLMNQAVAKVLK